MAIRKRVSLVLLYQGQILGFQAKDPTSGREYFFLPGGEIEEDETPEEAMVREAWEETGYRVKILSDISLTRRYQFHWDGKDYDCETIYFAGELLSSKADPVDDQSYHMGVDWVQVEELNEVFSYHKDVLEPVVELSSRLLASARG